MTSQSTDELVKRIDEAVARFPIRNEGVYWLHADEWNVLKDTIGRLQRELTARDKTIETLQGLVDGMWKWLGDMLAAIDAARSEGGKP